MTTLRLKPTYSSREVASITGLTARQLQVWDAGGLIAAVVPTHRTESGGYTERRYTPIELFELAVLADLRRRGFSVHQLHSIVDTLRSHFHARLFDATRGSGPVQLLTNGREVYVRTRNGSFYNLLAAPTQPLLVVGDEHLLKELAARVSARRRPRGRKGGPSESGKSSRGRPRDAG